MCPADWTTLHTQASWILASGNLEYACALRGWKNPFMRKKPAIPAVADRCLGTQVAKDKSDHNTLLNPDFQAVYFSFAS